MRFTLSRSASQDRAAILALLVEARGEDLSEDERARVGFVQGNLDEALVARWQSGSGVFVAHYGTILAGVVVTSQAAEVTSGPPAASLAAARQALPELPAEQFFMYGPVAVARSYQGQGLLTRLLLRACAELRHRFSLGVAFVELANQRSLAVHRHYPMFETAQFSVGARHYAVFTFSPAQVLNHYRGAGEPRE